MNPALVTPPPGAPEECVPGLVSAYLTDAPLSGVEILLVAGGALLAMLVILALGVLLIAWLVREDRPADPPDLTMPSVPSI